MAVNDFLARLGFIADPFESTDAEDEPNLDEYFVPPPYFTSVLGDPANPKSQVVLAPRGGGKTAQRRMIERYSAEAGNFLCISYDRFETPSSFSLTDATWSYHIEHVLRLMLVGVLVKLDDEPGYARDALLEHDRQLLKHLVDRYLGSASEAEFKAGVQSLKNFGEKAADFWNKHAGLIAVAVNAVLKRAGISDTPVPASFAENIRRDEGLRFTLEQMSTIILKLGFDATYILVDKVDELALTTTDASSVFAFISSLMTDLATLQTPGLAFKFFIWDKVEGAYRAAGARPDRVSIYRLNWSVDELQAMMQQRLRAYSNGSVASLNEIADMEDVDLDRLVAYLSNGSPRDMIRTCRRIVDEQTRSDTSAAQLSRAAVWRGVKRFADERALELVPEKYLNELRKVGVPTFTTNVLASDVFRVQENAIRRKLQLWTETGTVTKIAELPNPKGRPVYLHGIVDCRVALAASRIGDVELLCGNVLFVCASCDLVCISDRGVVYCATCQSEATLDDAVSLLTRCAM